MQELKSIRDKERGRETTYFCNKDVKFADGDDKNKEKQQSCCFEKGLISASPCY